MQESKYKELKNMIANLDRVITGKLLKSERIVNGLMTVIRDYDSQLQTLKAMIFSKGLLDTAEYEAGVDLRRGLRIKGETEAISEGDVVWVDFHASVVNDKTKKIEIVGFENGMPVRVGSGAVSFEAALVGKTLGQTVEHKEIVKEEGALKNQEITFNVTIRKVKTKLTLAKEAEDGQSGTTGDRGPVEGEGTDQSPAHTEGHGQQPNGHSEPVPLQ